MLRTLLLVVLCIGLHAQDSVLLICDESHVDAWQPFADWKKQCGKPTFILAVQDIDKKFNGADTQEKMKAAVTKYVDERHCKWVVLGGDSTPARGLVPDRNTVHALYNAKLYQAIPADCYYVSNATWNSNDDKYYGFWNHDKENINYTGKACIGRIPIRTVEDIKNYTQKVIEYESEYPTDAYAQTFLYTCAVPFADYKAAMYWDQILGPSWNEGTCDKFFCSQSPWDGEQAGDFDITPKNYIERINKKTHGKMHQHGHGLLPLWVLEHDQVLDVKKVAQLTNSKAYPIMTTVSCFTGNFDALQDPCITESMLRAKQSGAIAIIAPAREGVPIFPHWARDPKDGKTQDGTTRLMTQFWYQGITKNLTIGEAFAAAKQEMSKDASLHPGYHWCCSEINLLGDPTLDMRAKSPQVYTLSIDMESLPVAASKSITCRLDKPLAQMFVCVWKGDECYQIVAFDETGSAVVELPVLSAGVVFVTVYGPNQNSTQQQISVR